MHLRSISFHRRPVLDTGFGYFSFVALGNLAPCQARGDEVAG